MKRILHILIFAITIISCNSKKKEDLATIKLCTELYTDTALTEMNAERPEFFAAALHNNLWWHSVNFQLLITVRFLNGTDFQKDKVRQYAKTWNEASATGFNNTHKIKIVFYPYEGSSSGNITDLRIIFRQGGSSSYIGSDAKRIPQNQPTMFFGWINPGEPEESIRQVVLHEFGHALGLIHEHQSPSAGVIPWDKEKVYDYYYRTQNPPWDRTTVDANIFFRYSASETNYTSYDSTSIMHYAIPASITTGGYSTPWNSVLSPTDKAFIKTLYLYYPCVVNETCCFDRKGKRILCP